MRLHRAFNHPPHVTLARLLARAGAKANAVNYALVFPNNACGTNVKNHKHPSVTTVPGRYRFNDIAFPGTCFAHDMSGALRTLLSIVDGGACFHAVA